MRYGARRSQARKYLYGILRVSQGGFVSRLLPNDVMSSSIMTAIVRARLTVGAFADAGTCIQDRYLTLKEHFAPRDEGIFF